MDIICRQHFLPGGFAERIYEMNNAMTIDIEGVGPILFERSKKARKLNISVKPYKLVRVAVPLGFSFDRAKAIVKSKVRWIQKHFLQMKEWEKKHQARVAIQGSIDKGKARRELIERLQQLAKEYNFKYNRISIRNQRTRWGSCSARNNINLNINLAQLPDRLRDYIILHELLHIRIKDHSKHFWAELTKLTGNAKALRREVRSYHLGLME